MCISDLKLDLASALAVESFTGYEFHIQA
jgi:hypothetical protein